MDNLSLDEMKRIAYEVVDSEKREFNIELNVFPITFVEYFKSYLSQKKFSLSRKVFMSFYPLISGGFNDSETGDVVIFLTHLGAMERIEGKLFHLLNACYHEARHSQQFQSDEYSYYGFFQTADYYIREATFDLDYMLEHDSYLSEIDANLYGVRRAKEYLMERYPDLYKKYEEDITFLEKKYQYDLAMYDPSYTIDRYIALRKVYDRLDRIGGGGNVILLGSYPDSFSDSFVFDIFLNDDNSFKKMSEILNDRNFKKLDERIVYAFFSSQTFLNSVDISELTEIETIWLKKSLEYANNLYEYQEKATEIAEKDEIIPSVQALDSKKSIFQKISCIVGYYDRMLCRYLNITRNEFGRRRHIDNVISYDDYLSSIDEEERTEGRKI